MQEKWEQIYGQFQNKKRFEIGNFNEIFQKVYSRENIQFINVNTNGAYFSSISKNDCCSFRVTDMMDIS